MIHSTYLTLNRQAHAEGAPFAFLALHINAAAVHMHQVAGDRQTQAGPFGTSFEGAIALPELFEDGLQISLADAGAGIFYLKTHPSVIPRGA